jgi:proline iminopeptidase
MTNAFDQGHLDVGQGHKIHYAQYGHARGEPALVLHGGPGGKSSLAALKWFDLNRYRVILVDQRGCGLSLPRGHIQHNNTQELILDIEKLRQYLHIQQWLVVGGSWGACLALLYAGSYAQHLKALILRGSFLASQRELDWFFQGLRLMAPYAWEELTQGWNAHQKLHVLHTLQQAILKGTEQEARTAAQRWFQYESRIVSITSADSSTTSSTTPSTTPTSTTSSSSSPALASDEVLDSYTIQAHYLAEHCFTSERAVFRQARKLTQCPVTLVHGKLDMICPPYNALRLSRFIPHAKLNLVRQGGHIGADPHISQALHAAVLALEK